MKEKIDLWWDFHPYLKKLFMELKTAIFIIVVSVSNVIATATYSQVTIVSSDMENSCLENVLDKTVRNNEFHYNFNQKQIDVDRVVDIQADNKLITDILPELNKGTDVNYAVFDRKILLTSDSFENELKAILLKVDLQQQISVSGTVTDALTGEPITGANIVVKSTTVGALTDLNGKYSIIVSDENAILLFSFIGYILEEVPLAGKKILDIKMRQSLQSIGEVVVTALNVKRDTKGLGYIVENIKGDKINEVKTTSLANTLAGKVPGLDISNTANGVAGSKRVILRGISSITGNNQPLWIIDGIPINSSILGSATPDGGGGIDLGDGLTGINSDNIESISVLKGNAAAALYGSRASNGVIIITTKAGNDLNKKFEVNYRSTFTIDQAVDLSDWQYQYGQGIGGKKPQSQQEALLSGNAGWGAKLDGTNVVQFDGIERPYQAYKDNLRKFYTNGSSWTNTISLSGHSENHNFRLSFGRLNNKDIVPNSSYKRNDFSIHSESKFGNLSVNVVTNLIDEKTLNRQRIGGNYSNIHYTLLYTPANINILDLRPGYDLSGNEIGFNNQGIPTNPYFVTNKIHQDDSRERVIGSLEVKYSFAKWLYAKSRVMVDYYSFKDLEYTPSGVIWSPKGGGLNQISRDNNEINYEFIIGSSLPILKKVNFNGFIGGNIYKTETEAININGTVFVINGIYTANNLSVKYPSTSFSQKQTNSLFGSAEFSYDNTIFLNFTGRKDWFSTLPLKSNSLFYPSLSLSYVFSQQLSLPSWFSLGKIRGSIAQVSGDTNPYQLDLGYVLDRDQYNGLNLQRVSNTTVPNVNLQPLLSSEFEMGTDLEFLNSTFGLHLTYYNRKTTQDIVTTQVSNTSGYQSAILNVGEIVNKGVEASLRILALHNENFMWEITGNFSYNNNKVIDLGENLSTIQLGISKTGSAFINVEKGYPYSVIRGYTYKKDANGEIVYDANGFPLSTSTTQILGHGLYNKIAGLSNTISYKNITLYFLIDGKFGAQIYSEQNALAVSNGRSKLTLEGRENGLTGNGVTENGSINDIVVSVANLNQYYGRQAGTTSNFVYDASFVKLREVSLGFKLPKILLGKSSLLNGYISLVGRNLFIFYKKTPNIDPETNTVSGNAQGISATVYPTVRNYGINLNLNF